MPPRRLPRLGIVVGTRCMFDCRHCLIKKEERCRDLSDREKRLLHKVVATYAPRTLTFTGGESTLYVDDINYISSGHPCPEKLNLGIVTNGNFAVTAGDAKRVLGSVRFLREVQVSYDKFHAEFLPYEKLENIYRACVEMGLGFRIIVTMQSPLDLSVVAKINGLGPVKTGIQPVCNIGEAGKNGLAFEHAVFDDKILRKSCPNRTQLVYQCGKGFSVCCSNLIYNEVYPDCLHGSPMEHFESNFYKTIRKNTFGRLVRELGVDRSRLLPEHSSACELCEYLFLHTDIAAKIKKGALIHD